ncbi:MAG TPA: Lrp/AsnC family transcriptional regulator [Telluria sp.]
MELDRFDMQILDLMQQDAGVTASDLASLVPLSASAIQRRVRRMRQEGVIEKDISVVDPARLGNPITCLVSVALTSERPELAEQFRKWLKASPAVQQVYYVTGDTDYVLVLTAPSTAAFEATMARMVAENPNVKRFNTNVVLNTLKRSLAIPVPA